jgi:hypothetical protein
VDDVPVASTGGGDLARGDAQIRIDALWSAPEGSALTAQEQVEDVPAPATDPVLDVDEIDVGCLLERVRPGCAAGRARGANAARVATFAEALRMAGGVAARRTSKLAVPGG